jgi:hypothetical protein
MNCASLCISCSHLHRCYSLRLLANLMLPDGAEKQLEDWTIFFLNQAPFNTIAPVLALETPEPRGPIHVEDESQTELLYVLNLVRTKHDKSVRRCVHSVTSSLPQISMRDP